MDNRVSDFLNGSQHEELWHAIADRRMDVVLSLLPAGPAPEKKAWFDIFRKPALPVYDPVMQVVSHMLFAAPGDYVSKPDLSLKDKGDEHFRELLRFFFAVYLNGEYEVAVKNFSKTLCELLYDLAEEVRTGAGDYPNTTIQGYVWGGGAALRECCVPLAAYFAAVADTGSRAFVLQQKCTITTSIMSHYPETVGPDMIEAAQALEAANKPAMAMRYYKAVIADFERIAEEIKDDPEELVSEEQMMSIQSLKKAYVGMERLVVEADYSGEIGWLNGVIEKGVTYRGE